jgi:aryl-phospho-beta-D-glucosidase BglC (GH1 family)
MRLHIEKNWFVDEYGRRILLRGVNFTASSKIPVKPNGSTHIKTDFRDHRDVSFIGRPIKLGEAEEHFTRLKHWGFNCLRFLITWEAIEHAGPGKYDKDFLEYIEELLKIAEEKKFYVFIDPHQDCWSRMSGGDGAPGWTFEKVGIDFTKFHEAGAAWLMQYRYDPRNPSLYPSMSWSQSRIQFGCATMFTLFFGGRDFAPSCIVDGQNVQDYLQSHYIEAFKQIAIHTKDMSHVLGFDSLNEPTVGFIGLKLDGSNINFNELIGYAFTPIHAILTGAGFTQKVPFKEVKGLGIKEIRCDEINPKKISCWIDGVEDLWKKEGVWNVDENNKPIILNNDYFIEHKEKEINFFRDYLSPFICRFAEDIRSIKPDNVIFYEGPAEAILKGNDVELVLPKNVVNAPHWYDVATMGLHRFMDMFSYDFIEEKILFGRRAIKKAFTRQMTSLKTMADKYSAGSPTILGEFGLPYDINKKRAYKTFKDKTEKAWASHIKALTWYYDAIDTNLLSSCQWNYNPANCNKWGDLWNLEDFSIFSRDQQTVDWKKDINSGGRAIQGFCRPHFISVAGIPLQMEFNMKNKTFFFAFDGDTSIGTPTIIYVPNIQYPKGYHVEVSEGMVQKSEETQLVTITIHQNGLHNVNITRK